MKQKGKIWTDAKGREVPTYAISPVLKIEEKYAHRIAAAAKRAEAALQKVVDLAVEAYGEVYEAKVTDAKMRGNKTNFSSMTIDAFDNTVEVKITKPESMYFDNTYTDMVKLKFDEYFDSLNAGNETAVFLKDLVKDLMFTSGGRLDNSKVLKLRKYRNQINASKKLAKKASKFVEAVDLFDKAIKNKPGSTGVYIKLADDAGKMRKVNLKYTDLI
jgi:glutamine cyclotransferase